MDREVRPGTCNISNFRLLEKVILFQGGRDLSEFIEWKETVEADKKAAEESKRIESIIQAWLSNKVSVFAKTYYKIFIDDVVNFRFD